MLTSRQPPGTAIPQGQGSDGRTMNAVTGLNWFYQDGRFMQNALARTSFCVGNADDDQLTPAHFDRIAGMVSDVTGICLPPQKRLMVEARLRKRMRVLGISTVAAYCEFLFQKGGLAAETRHLIDVVTTNKTDFFREIDHFHYLTDGGVAALLRSHQRVARANLRFWSAACSNGAEVYTIAMCLSDMAARVTGFDFSILGTDISGAMLQDARRAIYPASFLAPLTAEQRHRYLLDSRDPERAEVRIAPELRRKATFAHLNLMDKNYPFAQNFDAIFLRNVLIYFDRADQIAVVRRLLNHLQPFGFLFLGHSETSVAADLPVRQIAPAIFQRL